MKIMPICCSFKRNNDSTANKMKFRNSNNVDTVSFSANRLNAEEIKKLAQEATEWWCKKLTGGYKYDNGEPGAAADMLLFKASNGKISDSVKATSEQISKFRESLVASLEKEIDEAAQGTELWETNISIGVDYNPHLTLSNALKQAGFSDYEVNCSCLPIKTGMDINTENRSIIVSDGYQKPWETIFELPKN